MDEHGKDEDGARRSSAANRGSYIRGVDDVDIIPDLEQPVVAAPIVPSVIPDAPPSPTTPSQSNGTDGAVEEKEQDAEQKQVAADDVNLVETSSCSETICELCYPRSEEPRGGKEC